GPAIGDVRRRFVGEGRQNSVAKLGDWIQAPLNIAQQYRRDGRGGKGWDDRQGARQGQQIARASGGQRNSRQQPFEIENRFQRFSQLGAQNRGSVQFFNRVQARLNLALIDGGSQKTPAHKPAAHAGARAIQHG